jgi:predicted dehydrogenase
MGPYYVAALVQMLGPIVSVTGTSSRLRSQRTIATGPRAGEVVAVLVDTHVSGVLEHTSGVLSTITTSFDSVATRAPQLEVHGERATLIAPDPNHFAGDVELRALGSSGWELVPPSAGAVDASRGAGLIDMMKTPRGTLSRASGAMALHSLEVMVMLLESARLGRRIDIESTIHVPALLPFEEL